MKVKDLRELSPEELATKEQDLIQELFNLRFQMFTGQLENSSRLTQVKRDVARIKTVRRELDLQGKKNA
ncbi:MAG: 50S ribosomal protein L29 [Myxococcales bacterium]|nr:50S ribosomal protein L29 [Myxococcales bacterium]